MMYSTVLENNICEVSQCTIYCQWIVHWRSYIQVQYYWIKSRTVQYKTVKFYCFWSWTFGNPRIWNGNPSWTPFYSQKFTGTPEWHEKGNTHLRPSWMMAGMDFVGEIFSTMASRAWWLSSWRNLLVSAVRCSNMAAIFSQSCGNIVPHYIHAEKIIL